VLDQAPGGGDFLFRVENVDRLADFLGLDSALTELSGQRSPGQAAAVVPGLDPGAGKRRVVDQANVGEAAKHGLGGLARHAAAAERGGELRPGPGRGGQQPQADLPGLRFRVTGRRLVR